jgi:hypothetical protein
MIKVTRLNKNDTTDLTSYTLDAKVNLEDLMEAEGRQRRARREYTIR